MGWKCLPLPSYNTLTLFRFDGLIWCLWGDYKTVLITGKRYFDVHIWVTIEQLAYTFLSAGNAEHDLILSGQNVYKIKYICFFEFLFRGAARWVFLLENSILISFLVCERRTHINSTVFKTHHVDGTRQKEFSNNIIKFNSSFSDTLLSWIFRNK